MSVFAPVAGALQTFGTATALVEGDRRWTFGELNLLVGKVAAGLSRRLAPGSRVGLYMHNRAEYAILQLALECAGLVRVPLNARYTAVEVERIIDDCGAAAVFFEDKTAAGVLNLHRPGLWLCQVDGESEAGPSWPGLSSSEGGPDRAGDDLDALCSINYTSGSSGVPKGVMLTHRHWRSVYKNMLVDRDIRGSDRLAHIGPLTHASGAYMTPFMLRGATNVILEGDALANLLPTIERERITAFSCVPTVLTRILNDPSIGRHDLSSLRWIGYGAEPIQRNTLGKAIARWGDVLTHNYGLTEAMMTCSYLPSRDHVAPNGEIRAGCIGRPYTFVDLVLRDGEGAEVAVGEVGEITVSAEHVMKGYWNRPDETARVLRGGWLWTGDLARRDEDGFISIVGRSKEMLISGGFNIYPAEIEACMSACPGVLEVAVVGTPDEQWGEIGVAFVVAEAGATLNAENCMAHCKPRIGIRTPRRWVFLPALPRTGNGKVDKHELRRRLEPEGLVS